MAQGNTDTFPAYKKEIKMEYVYIVLSGEPYGPLSIIGIFKLRKDAASCLKTDRKDLSWDNRRYFRGRIEKWEVK